MSRERGPDLLLLLPAAAQNVIKTGVSGGDFTVRVSDPENVAAVVAIGSGGGPLLPVPLSPASHFLSSADSRPVGRWYRVDPDLHGAWLTAMARSGVPLRLEVLKNAVSRFMHGDHLAITYAPDVDERFPEVGVPELVAWAVQGDSLIPIQMDREREGLGLGQLMPGWPVPKLAQATVMVVGVGSIGAAAALSLATYGVGRLLLVDPDRLLWHNLVRHVGSNRHVGKLKVDAVAEQIEALRPDTATEALPLDVVADADEIRALIEECDVILCAADGVAPRRVVSHLARRGKVPAVLTCVLDDGAVGEVIRLQPWPSHGCLLCQRERLRQAGAIDPEPSLDAGYGRGTRHRPMTAVGADLHLVGQFAAKVTVATYLERGGYADQRLPGESALLALRPQLGLAAPFDLEACGEIRWSPSWKPTPGCPTCEAS